MFFRVFFSVAVFSAALCSAQNETANWKGVLHDAAGRGLARTTLTLTRAGQSVSAVTASDGAFEFSALVAGHYGVKLQSGRTVELRSGIDMAAGALRLDGLRLNAAGELEMAGAAAASESTGGEQLSNKQVSSLPLNKRDFSQLLLLATGTQTDTNGAANFTQQFTVNGQRGSATVFSMDGVDTTDPEMGGATFSNFNVDAIQEINSSSGVLAAEIGHGAAGYTAIVSKSGTADLHGSVFEFLRNAALDARNFFDRQTPAEPRRIPPFNRNEFGFTLGGPIRRNRTFFFGQYQGFRQMLSTTQVVPVPTADERRGLDATAFAGDTLYVPVNSKIASVLNRYPLPNDPQGSYGARTYATSSKVQTVTDQFSIRVDHTQSERSRWFSRFNSNLIDGPLTNPSQTAIDPSFAIKYFDRQRNAAVGHVWTPTARFTMETWAGFVRSTPNFPTLNRSEPAMLFSDSLYESFNAPGGSVMGAFGNLFQLRQNFALLRGRHNWKAGYEIRSNRDTTVFGMSPNGSYMFGGGVAYSPVEMRSASGGHNIHVGDPLPSTLSAFLSASPFSYSVAAAPALFGQGEQMGDTGIHRDSYNFFVQDAFKIGSRVTLNYGLRYEVNSQIRENKLRTSGVEFIDASGVRTSAYAAGAQARLLVNPQPVYPTDWSGWAPRVALDFQLSRETTFHVAAALTTLMPNLWQTNCATGGLPYVASVYMTAAPGAPLPFDNKATAVALPGIYDTSGAAIFGSGRSTDVKANTVLDTVRFQRELAALSSDHQVRALNVQGIAMNFRNGYMGSYTAGVEHSLGDVKLSAAYVATTGVKLARMEFPNNYGGADPAYAPYTKFDSAGRIVSGFGPLFLITNGSHSTYHSLQTSASKTSLRGGLGFQASYTWSRSIDDTSAVLGGFIPGASGPVLQTSAQNPGNLRQEKGPSTFDIGHTVSFSLIEDFSLQRVAPRLGRRFNSGWQLMGMSTMATGAPLTVYSGVQQTGVGSNGADRPDLLKMPQLSTSRPVREDYFGLGANNASLFNVPINVAGGSGPFQGRFGTLGRNALRAPGMRSFDVSLIKNTPIGRAGNAERVMLQARAEFFNVFNIVNFGLPANIVTGPGFGVISRTATPSRQIQVSLKIVF